MSQCQCKCADMCVRENVVLCVDRSVCLFTASAETCSWILTPFISVEYQNTGAAAFSAHCGFSPVCG